MGSKTPPGRIGLPIVVARIVSVSAVGFAAAIGIFLIIGGLWQVGLISLGVMLLFLFLLFFIERAAERDVKTS